MVEFTHILCPIDFSSASARTLACAAAIARLFRARITLLHVEPALGPLIDPSSEGVDPGYLLRAIAQPAPDAMAALERTVEASGVSDLHPGLIVSRGRPSDVIASHVAALPADLVVMSTHGRSGFTHLLLGSVTEKVLRKVPCPVLTVPPALPLSAAAPIQLARIVCPLDFSPASLKALRVAVDLASRAPDGRVLALHAIEYVDDEEPCEHVPVDIRAYRAHLIEHARERLHAALETVADASCGIEEAVVVARAYREILKRTAGWNADLVVMGAQGTGALELWLYGSNTQHVLRAARCPVLTVQP